MSNSYIQIVHKDLKQDVVQKIYDGEMQIEGMKLDHVEEISKAHELWTAYRKSLIL
jgi:hypothetical protein